MVKVTDVKVDGKTFCNPSLEEWLIAKLKAEGSQTMQALSDLPDVNWAQFCRAVDRLRRSGFIELWHLQDGTVLVHVSSRRS
jgi:hypothetical protein